MQELDLPALDTIQIPDKTHFKIGEVAKLLDLEPYVLRYWEKEFDVLEPSKTDSGQRAYQRDDIELLATIQKLLYTEMFTIDGARRQLELAREGEFSYLTATLGGADDEGSEQVEDALEEVQWENEQLRLELEQTEEELRDERARLRERVAELESALEEARESAGADEERLGSLRAKNDELRSENESLESRLSRAHARIEKLQQEKERLEASDASLGDDEREVVEALQREVSALADIARN